jgi:hypothetical protein
VCVRAKTRPADAATARQVLDTTEAGWKQNFWDRIRKVFGYGA